MRIARVAKHFLVNLVSAHLVYIGKIEIADEGPWFWDAFRINFENAEMC
jgi:hypothetical protein